MRTPPELKSVTPEAESVVRDVDQLQGPRHTSTMRRSNGCWTCRLRRKKCDESHPVCDACAALCIICHYDQNDKPEWMDGGVKQEEMAEQLKREIKEKAHRRHGERVAHISDDHVSVAGVSTGKLIVLPQKPPRNLATPICDLLRANLDVHNDEIEPSPEASTISLQRGADCTLTSKNAREKIAFGRSDTILLSFYLEHLLPFLFPFYHPSLLQSGRAWTIELMISSPVVRQATLCQSSYFFSLARGTANRDTIWDEVLQLVDVVRVPIQIVITRRIFPRPAFQFGPATTHPVLPGTAFTLPVVNAQRGVSSAWHMTSERDRVEAVRDVAQRPRLGLA